MVDMNSSEYLKSSRRAYLYTANDGSVRCEKEIYVSGNNSYTVALLANEL